MARETTRKLDEIIVGDRGLRDILDYQIWFHYTSGDAAKTKVTVDGVEWDVGADFGQRVREHLAAKADTLPYLELIRAAGTAARTVDEHNQRTEYTQALMAARRT